MWQRYASAPATTETFVGQTDDYDSVAANDDIDEDGGCDGFTAAARSSVARRRGANDVLQPVAAGSCWRPSVVAMWIVVEFKAKSTWIV